MKYISEKVKGLGILVSAKLHCGSLEFEIETS